MCDTKNNIIEFHVNKFLIKNTQTGKVVIRSKTNDGLYNPGEDSQKSVDPIVSYHASSNGMDQNSCIWHACLAYPPEKGFKKCIYTLYRRLLIL